MNDEALGAHRRQLVAPQLDFLLSQRVEPDAHIVAVHEQRDVVAFRLVVYLDELGRMARAVSNFLRCNQEEARFGANVAPRLMRRGSDRVDPRLDHAVIVIMPAEDSPKAEGGKL